MTTYFSYNCEGRHFKVYWTKKLQVLEHPSETETVSLNFSYENLNQILFLVIKISDYIISKMRIPGQHLRADLYVLPHEIRPLGKLLIEALRKNTIEQKSFQYRYNKPVARNQKQSVPNIVKIGELNVEKIIAPFRDEILILKNGICALDLETPGRDQTRWKREGAFKQLHF